MRKFIINKEEAPSQWSALFRGRDMSDTVGCSPEYNGPIDHVFAGGSIDFIQSRDPRIAIVGTRDMSPYGKSVTEHIVASLAAMVVKPIVFSGLALGIDANAHRAALNNGLNTVAVLPTGLDEIYPRAHKGLAESIVESGGCLITDFPEQTAPTPINFLHRNQLLVKMVDMVIVVESKAKGGAMVVAKLAKDFNIPVFAVPGRIDDVRSIGCNQLIADRIARPLPELKKLETMEIKAPLRKWAVTLYNMNWGLNKDGRPIETETVEIMAATQEEAERLSISGGLINLQSGWGVWDSSPVEQ